MKEGSRKLSNNKDCVSHVQRLVNKAVDLETPPAELGTYAALWRLASRTLYSMASIQEDPVSHLQRLVDKAVDLETPPEELATYAALWRLAPYLDDDAVAAAQLLVQD